MTNNSVGTSSCWSGFLRGFVPKGLNEGSQAVYCLECAGNEVRPVGYGVIVSSRLARYLDDTVTCANHTVPTGRVALLRIFQAINCLATIIASLRDKTTQESGRAGARPYRN
jgi:hypothetical protein